MQPDSFDLKKSGKSKKLLKIFWNKRLQRLFAPLEAKMWKLELDAVKKSLIAGFLLGKSAFALDLSTSVPKVIYIF